MSALPERLVPSQQDDPWRDSQLGLLGAVGAEGIWDLSLEELSRLRITPLSSLGGEVIEFPRSWMPSGTLQLRCHRVIEITKLASPSHPKGSPGYEAARLVLLRMLLALWVVPRHLARRGTILVKPSTYVAQCAALVGLVRLVLERGGATSGKLFSELPDDVSAAVMNSPEIAKTRSLMGVLGALFDLSRRGIIKDWFRDGDDSSVMRDAIERSRRGDETLRSQVHDEGTWQPLPDEFVTELGWRCLWFMENLGPGLVDCYERCMADDLRDRPKGDRAAIREREAIIRDFDWRAADGSRIEKLPFALKIVGMSGTSGRASDAIVAWPPKRFVTLKQCMTFLQTCHLFVVMLAMGARWSEVSGLPRRCLAPGEAEQRVEGKTWKLVDALGGAVRDWPLHPLAAHAIRQQIKLADLLRPTTDTLWVPLVQTSKGESLDGLASAAQHLQRLARATGILPLLAGTSLHPHRFRKTIARLAALALVGAPKILMDLFGHRSIEMTLRYILSDPTLAAEIEEVAKAQVIMLGEQAIATIESNGGPAANALRTELARAMRGDRKPLGADDIREAAEILTMQGKSVQQVRPNVLCTKGPHEAGPCTRNVGHPDPSRCKARCDHRLELAAARADVDQAISQCVAMLRDAAVSSDEMQWAFWRGQLAHHIARFEDIGVKWRRFPDVIRFLEERIAA